MGNAARWAPSVSVELGPAGPPGGTDLSLDARCSKKREYAERLGSAPRTESSVRGYRACLFFSTRQTGETCRHAGSQVRGKRHRPIAFVFMYRIRSAIAAAG
jgi:hypothetical protein